MLSFFSQFSFLAEREYDKYTRSTTSNATTPSSSSSDPAINLTGKASSPHLYRLPTFSYSPRRIKRQQTRQNERSGRTTIASCSFSSSLTNFSISSSSNSSEADEPLSSSIYYDEEKLISKYVSFPSLEESHPDIKRKSIYELEMESYDEMLVGGIRI
ncbi:11412_t:CDS:2 [Ambispora leptoticha]|uniref:11412_t:CDS:1 n=1 Tax=Ambispora leptoticha TaxID=144679 RepID=A0A9N9AQT1_9GLOM|nr:11412_t:CDS:2 [Ambispora leptoticha]